MITAARLHQAWRALPFGALDDLIGRGNALILAPHPDDESLGCGGLIAACCAAGRFPVVAILTDGSASHPGSREYPPRELAALRERETLRAVRILGLPADRLVFLREQDSRAPRDGPAFDAVVRRVAQCVTTFGCTTIMAPWRWDPHCDHEAAGRIASAAAKVTQVTKWSYPVWGWTLAGDSSVAGALDAGALDAGALDAGALDAGALDAGALDAGALDDRAADDRASDDRTSDERALNNRALDAGWRLDVSAYRDVKRRAIAAHASQYTAMISDSSDAFRLPVDLLAAVDQPWEVFLAS